MPSSLYSLKGHVVLGNMVLAGILHSHRDQSPAVDLAAPPWEPTKARIPALFAPLEAGQQDFKTKQAVGFSFLEPASDDVKKQCRT